MAEGMHAGGGVRAGEIATEANGPYELDPISGKMGL